MVHRTLSKTEVEKIVSQAKSQSSHQPISFFAENIIEIAEAVENNKSHVIIKGRGFSIKRTPYYDGSILINPDVGFVPCGYIALITLRHALEDQDVN